MEWQLNGLTELEEMSDFGAGLGILSCWLEYYVLLQVQCVWFGLEYSVRYGAEGVEGVESSREQSASTGG